MNSRVAAIVVCSDRGRFLEPTLASLDQQTMMPAETVIVDCGSSDLFTRQVLERLRCRGHAVMPAPNVFAATQAGVRATTAELLLFLDCRCRLTPQYVATAVALMIDGPRRFVAARSPANPHVPADDIWLETVASGVAPGCACLVPRALWTGIMPDDVTGVDAELEFWLSAAENGAVCSFLPADSVAHHAGAMQDIGDLPVDVGPARNLYLRHQRGVRQHAAELVARKGAILARERERKAQLERRTQQLEMELAATQKQVDTLIRRLPEGGGRVEWGDLRRLAPLSPFWGSDRGTPVNRYYIHRFLDRHRDDIRGVVVEVKDDLYTEAFGTAVTRKEILDVDVRNERATLTADLTRADGIPSAMADCFLLTQVLNVIFDVRRALHHVHRLLKPGGVLLCTVAALDRVTYEDRGADDDYWRFTEASVRALLAEFWPVAGFEVSTYGNVMTCAAHLYGMSAEEMTPQELDHSDPSFPLIVTARAVKPPEASHG